MHMMMLEDIPNTLEDHIGVTAIRFIDEYKFSAIALIHHCEMVKD